MKVKSKGTHKKESEQTDGIAFPRMASIDTEIFAVLSKAHMLYAQEMYLARVKKYESSCKGKCNFVGINVGIRKLLAY